MKKTKQINVGGVLIGGGTRIKIQSMCNTATSDVEKTVDQINALASEGCDIVRVAVPDLSAARAIKEIKKHISIPIVADIHFDYRLAVAAAENGADKVRINPGNIGDNLKYVVDSCLEKNIPIRVGVNSGSLEKDLLAKYGNTPEALAESALKSADKLLKLGFDNICLSLKSSSVINTVKAYRIVSEKTDMPLHVGVTEAGSAEIGTIKSAAAIGALLTDGIGDTIRVSLTDDPVLEVSAAKKILKALEMNTYGVNIISCPTCGRTKVDLIKIAKEVEDKVSNIKTKMTVAVMGCAVNGPGEAKNADVGIACGAGEGLIFKNGQIICKVPEDSLVPSLLSEIEKMSGEKI